ncbi:tRNA pseudouridine(55) synthase, partial [Vibrio parahaemolyticus V-223/04]
KVSKFHVSLVKSPFTKSFFTVLKVMKLRWRCIVQKALTFVLSSMTWAKCSVVVLT